MLSTCEQKIMELLLPHPFRANSIRKISKLIKSSYALTYTSVQSLRTKRIIKVTKLGNSCACQPNLSADPQLLALSSLEQARKVLAKTRFGFVIDEIKVALAESLYILALFGSQVKGTATAASDVDLLFVLQNEKDIEETKRKVRSVLSSTNIKIEFDVITAAWLENMFEEKHSVGREILESCIILHGAEQYYTLVRKYDQKRGY